MSGPADQATLLRIYLEDHAAGATAGVQRARRLADAEGNSSDASEFTRFAGDVASDLDTLLSLMASLELRPSRLKSTLASLAEKVGTLKLNGRVLRRSPSSTIVELEAMQMAVRGKRSLWETLSATVPETTIDLEGLIARADAQLISLTTLHTDRVPVVFGTRRPAGRQPDREARP